MAVRIARDPEGGFPDDLESPGPTVISTATLQEVAGWYPGHNEHDMRCRFRANLEFDDCPAFWEDQLYGDPDSVVNFRIGEVRFSGINPCQRCVVPTRDPSTGDELAGFQSTFTTRRRATLPAWANRARFDFFYRLAVNTRIAASETGKTIRVGDRVETC
jgi:MOSC domain-containing protein